MKRISNMTEEELIKSLTLKNEIICDKCRKMARYLIRYDDMNSAKCEEHNT